VATSRASPALASQAENANKSIGVGDRLVESSCKVQRDRATNRESIMLSRQRRADRRCVRWNARPASPRRKVDEKAK